MRRSSWWTVAALGCVVVSGCGATATQTATPTQSAAVSASSTDEATGAELTDVTEYAAWSSPELTEASGLAFLDSNLLTVNDSGDAAVVYVSAGTAGEVTGTITYADEDPFDVEAITVTADRTVYIGDVGDNAEVRDTIAIYTFQAPSELAGDQRVDSTRYVLTYPDGAHNAETILVDPSTGEVFVVTKDAAEPQVFSAGVLGDATQIELSEASVAQLPLTATDGAFNAAGDKVVIRTYMTLSIYAYPAWDQLGTVALPLQPQGEGLSLGPNGTWLIGSEKVGSTIWQFGLPLAD